MRKIIEFTGEVEKTSPKIKQVTKEKAPKDNSRKIASLQKQIEKMQSS